ncbi:phloem protein 2-like protein [Tanacetum coccineum]
MTAYYSHGSAPEKDLCFLIISQLIGVEIISLKDIKAATNCFSEESVIGKLGSSSNIYKGELSLFKRYIPVAVKRLDKVGLIGEGALLKEVVNLYHYCHKNIITIRGFCEEDNEKIIIMDHASNESLDRHLHKSTLTWGIRLKILKLYDRTKRVPRSDAQISTARYCEEYKESTN